MKDFTLAIAISVHGNVCQSKVTGLFVAKSDLVVVRSRVPTDTIRTNRESHIEPPFANETVSIGCCECAGEATLLFPVHTDALVKYLINGLARLIGAALSTREGSLFILSIAVRHKIRVVCSIICCQFALGNRNDVNTG